MTTPPKVIIGTWPLSGDFGDIENIEIENILNYAISKGFLEFDTAPNYGLGKIEKILSKVVKNHDINFKINTKCGNSNQGIKSFKVDDIRKSIDSSIEKFGNLNTVFLHNPRDEVKDWSLLIKNMSDYKKKNLIKNLGISLARNFFIDESILKEFDYIQEEINLLCFDSYKRLKNIKTKILARSPLASGVLSGKLFKGSKFSNEDHRSKWLKEERLENILEQLKNINKLSDQNISEFAKAFVLSLPSVNGIIFGIKSKEHIDQLVTMSDTIIKLDAKTLELIFELSNNNYNLETTKKGY